MVIPNNVTNPTIAPTDNQPPDIKTAITPPTKQKGRFKSTIIKFLLVLVGFGWFYLISDGSRWFWVVLLDC